MTKGEFNNLLKILRSIDPWEIEGFAKANPWTVEKINEFENRPYHFFMVCDDEKREVLWNILKSRHFAGQVQISINELQISTRAHHALSANCIHTVRDLNEAKDRLASLPGVGRVVRDECLMALAAWEKKQPSIANMSDDELRAAIKKMDEDTDNPEYDLPYTNWSARFRALNVELKSREKPNAQD